MEEFAEIRRIARVEGLSINALAKRFGVHRRTVRQALASAEPLMRKRPERAAPKRDAVRELIDVMLRQDIDAPRKQRQTATRIWHRLLDEHGAEVGYPTVRDYVRMRRPEIMGGPALKKAMVPQTHLPGAEAEVDFGEFYVLVKGVKTKCYLFDYRLSASGRSVHRVYPTQAQEAFLEGHIDAFEETGGIPTMQIKYDNLSPAVRAVVYGGQRQRGLGRLPSRPTSAHTDCRPEVRSVRGSSRWRGRARGRPARPGRSGAGRRGQFCELGASSSTSVEVMNRSHHDEPA